ncbi:MAG: hypothetical protein AAFN77_02610 [Planctomycetota bacterium]
MNAIDEPALGRKLASKWQLNVDERKSLLPAGLAASALVTAIGEIIKQSSRYPAEWDPSIPNYDGVVITATQNGFRTHTRHEIGIQRFSDATIVDFDTLEQAVRVMLMHVFSINNIDGIPIDWSR